MNPRFLLDTHIVVHWLAAPQKLSRDQMRAMKDSVRRQEPLAICAITLLEIAVLLDRGSRLPGVSVHQLLSDLELSTAFRIIPFTLEIAVEVAALGPSLRDPSDRAIVATARVHNLKLITSDQRIIGSGLVPVIG